MDDSLLTEFEQLKISAFSKYAYLKCDIGQVTLGPYSLQNDKPKQAFQTESKITSVPEDIQQHSNNEIENLIKCNEAQRIKNVRKNVQNHIENIENFSKQNHLYHHKKWLEAQNEFIKSQKEKDMKIIEANDEFDRNILDEHAKIEQQYQDMEEQRKLRKQELKKAEEKRKNLHLNVEKFTRGHKEFISLYMEILNIEKSVNKEKLKEKFGNTNDQLKNLLQQVEDIRNKCMDESITDADVHKCTEILASIKNIYNRIKEIIGEINKEKETNKVVATTETVSVTTCDKQIKSQEPLVENNSKTRVANSSNRIKDDKTFTMSKYISVSNFKFYCEIISFLGNHTKSFYELEHDTSLKQFRFDCKKAVNIPVNALSGVSSEHILDKYNRLYNLLKGQNVEVNDKIVNASKHPQGIAFCMDLLAKKLVLQGDLMVSSNPESAFCYASLIISLWNEIPSFGQLILAHFYTACPSIIPYTMPREVGETDEQFYKKCGYHYIDGQIETQDKFLKRMTGNCR